MAETDRRMPDSRLEVSQDAFLGGALKITQPIKGYRAGIDPVLLAASVDAHAGQSVLDLGAGVGVASLCLAHRVADLSITALEIQPELLDLLAKNVDTNGFDHCVECEGADILVPPDWIKQRHWDHVIFNPPYYAPESAMSAPNSIKAQSNMIHEGGLEDWMDFALKRLRPKGQVSLIHRADALDQILQYLTPRAGTVKVLPLWPRAGVPAKRIIVSAVKGAGGPLTLLPGLCLHENGRAFTPAADSILRHGAALKLE